MLDINSAPTRNDSWRDCSLAALHPEYEGSLLVGGIDTSSRSHVRGEKRSKVRLFRKGKGKSQAWLGPKRHLNHMSSMTHSRRWGNSSRHRNIRTSSLGSHLNTPALKGQVRLNTIQGGRMNSTIFSEDVLVINLHTLGQSQPTTKEHDLFLFQLLG